MNLLLSIQQATIDTVETMPDLTQLTGVQEP